MKNLIFLFLIIYICLFSDSCKKSNNSNSNSSSTPYVLNVTVNGINYSTSNVGISVFANQGGCNSKLYYLSRSTIYATNFDLYVSIKYLEYNADFSGSLPGAYSVKEESIGPPGENSICNLELEINYLDKTQANETTTLVGSNNIHNLTTITLKSQNSNSFTYDILGNFSFSVKNSANAVINITGYYKSYIETLK